MSLVRSKGSKAERIAFAYLRGNHIYFQKHYARAPGTPDIALPRKKKAVFVDGDFWHGRSYQDVLERYGASSYWGSKIRQNMERDQRKRSELKGAGWQVLVVWESDINRKSTQYPTLEAIMSFLTQDAPA